jgi:hypothetical protein
MLMKVLSPLTATFMLTFYHIFFLSFFFYKTTTNYITLQKVTTGQRMTESSVLDAHCTEVSTDHCTYPLRLLLFFQNFQAPISNIICRLTENRTGITSI